MVILTLLVNAPTAKPLLRAIGLTRLGEQERSMVAIARQTLRRVEADTLSRLYRTPLNGDANWAGVQKLAGLEYVLAAVYGSAEPTEYELEKRRWLPPPPPPSEGPGVPQQFKMVSAIYGTMVNRTQLWSRKAQILNHWRVLFKYLRDQILDELDDGSRTDTGSRLTALRMSVIEQTPFPIVPPTPEPKGKVARFAPSRLLFKLAADDDSEGLDTDRAAATAAAVGFKQMVGRLRQRQLHEVRVPSPAMGCRCTAPPRAPPPPSSPRPPPAPLPPRSPPLLLPLPSPSLPFAPPPHCPPHPLPPRAPSPHRRLATGCSIG